MSELNIEIKRLIRPIFFCINFEKGEGMKHSFKELNIFDKLRFIIGILSIMFFLFFQVYIFLNPFLIFEKIKPYIKINKDLVKLTEIDVTVVITNILLVAFFIFTWLFVSLFLGIVLFSKNNKVKMGIQTSFYGIILR